MVSVKTIEFPGYEELKNNFNKYKEIFLNEQIIAFRNANLNRKEQEEIMYLFGDNLGWYPNSSYKQDFGYAETHHFHIDKKGNVSKNELVLEWHQEHIEDPNLIFVSGMWNMELFECNPDAGKTYFVDMSKIYNSFIKEDKEFLDRCTGYCEGEIYKLVSSHWITNEKTIRTFFAKIENVSLHLIDDRKPTEIESEKFNLLHDQIVTQVWLNKDIRMEHSWKQGDLLIPDLFKLSHSVTGGFNKNERRLEGIFGVLPTPLNTNMI
jgi:alpha-ketoglutarate-dependent taurine dioxygenase